MLSEDIVGATPVHVHLSSLFPSFTAHFMYTVWIYVLRYWDGLCYKSLGIIPSHVRIFHSLTIHICTVSLYYCLIKLGAYKPVDMLSSVAHNVTRNIHSSPAAATTFSSVISS